MIFRKNDKEYYQIGIKPSGLIWLNNQDGKGMGIAAKDIAIDIYNLLDKFFKEKMIDICTHKDIDNVNHPVHYNSSKAKCSGCEKTIECIDITRHLGFNIGNCIKYLWRYELKNGIEDLKKAMWYLQDEINKQ